MEDVTTKYLTEDARNLDSFLDNNSVDVIITSPPYFGRKRYTSLPNEIGREKSIQSYLDNLRIVFKKCYRVAKNTGSLWVIVDGYRENGRYIPLPFLVFRELENCGWIPRDIMIWDKLKSRPWSSNGKYRFFRETFEFILFFSKTDNYKFYIDRTRQLDPKEFKQWWVNYPERYNPAGKVPSNVWRYLIPTQGWGKNFLKHFCPFPICLVERIVKLTTDEGDVVLDPFAGSGIVLAVSYGLGRKAIGFDISREYRENFSKVLEAVVTLKKCQNSNLIGEKFSMLLEKLRRIKVAKSILRSFRRIGVEAVIADNDEQSETISVVVLNPDKKKEIFSLLNHTVKHMPRWKFGVRIKIGYIGDEYKLKNSTYWIYTNNPTPIHEVHSPEDVLNLLDCHKLKNPFCLVDVNTQPLFTTISKEIRNES